MDSLPRILLKAFSVATNGAENIRSSNNALKIINTDHERVHRGRMFRHSEIHSLGVGESYNHLIIPNSGSINHLKSLSVKADNSIVHLGLHESPFTDTNSYGSDGTSAWVNQNRMSSNTPAFTTRTDPYINVNSLGTIIFEDLVTDVSKNAGGDQEGIPNEIILDPLKTYLLRVINQSNVSVASVVRFSAYDADN